MLSMQLEKFAASKMADEMQSQNKAITVMRCHCDILCLCVFLSPRGCCREDSYCVLIVMLEGVTCIALI